MRGVPEKLWPEQCDLVRIVQNPPGAAGMFTAIRCNYDEGHAGPHSFEHDEVGTSGA